MKSIKILAASIILAALAACGGQAKAAALPFNFTATDGVNFSIERASSVEKVGPTTISVTTMVVNADGVTVPTSTGYADSNGTVWTKVLSTINSTGLYLRVGSTNRYIGAKAVKYTYCFVSNTLLFYGEGVTEANETFNDGCAVAQGIKALSN